MQIIIFHTKNIDKYKNVLKNNNCLSIIKLANKKECDNGVCFTILYYDQQCYSLLQSRLYEVRYESCVCLTSVYDNLSHSPFSLQCRTSVAAKNYKFQFLKTTTSVVSSLLCGSIDISRNVTPVMCSFIWDMKLIIA